MELNELDLAVRALALRHAPQQIAAVGDIVTAQMFWRRPHRVRITGVFVQLVGIHVSIARRRELGLTGWLAVQHRYTGRRLRPDGTMVGNPDAPYILTEFSTDDGQRYEEPSSLSFNFAGLVFATEERQQFAMPPQQAPVTDGEVR